MVFTDKINIVMHHSSQGMFKKNILSKSLNVEVFKSTLGILLIFFFLVVSSRFVEYFNQAAEGLIDPNIIFKVIFWGSKGNDFFIIGVTDLMEPFFGKQFSLGDPSMTQKLKKTLQKQ